jgi:hypothetical protein
VGQPKKITAEEFDRMFDDGEDMTPYLDLSTLRHPGLEIRRINVDLPGWIVNTLDLEANHRGVTRQSIIKMWLVDRIEVEDAARAARRAVKQPTRKPTKGTKAPEAK